MLVKQSVFTILNKYLEAQEDHALGFCKVVLNDQLKSFGLLNIIRERQSHDIHSLTYEIPK